MAKIAVSGGYVVRPLKKEAKFIVNKKTNLGTLTFYEITDGIALAIINAARERLAEKAEADREAVHEIFKGLEEPTKK